MPDVDKRDGADNGVRLDGLTKYYRGASGQPRLIIDDLSLTVRPGEFVSIVGPSGCGKSTVLNILSGLDSDYFGSATVAGEVKGGFSYVFQEPRLLPWKTVRENVYFALECAGTPKSEWRDRCDDQLRNVGLTEFAGNYPHQLSGGMQQRAAIARAMVSNPGILLMDEPFSGLDEFTARRQRELLQRLWQGLGCTIVFVTHNVYESIFLSDRVIVLSRGPARICEEVVVELPHPRSYDDPEVFKLSSQVTNHILTLTDAPDSLVSG